MARTLVAVRVAARGQLLEQSAPAHCVASSGLCLQQARHEAKSLWVCSRYAAAPVDYTCLETSHGRLCAQRPVQRAPCCRGRLGATALPGAIELPVTMDEGQHKPSPRGKAIQCLYRGCQEVSMAEQFSSNCILRQTLSKFREQSVTG